MGKRALDTTVKSIAPGQQRPLHNHRHFLVLTMCMTCPWHQWTSSCPCGQWTHRCIHQDSTSTPLHNDKQSVRQTVMQLGKAILWKEINKGTRGSPRWNSESRIQTRINRDHPVLSHVLSVQYYVPALPPLQPFQRLWGAIFCRISQPASNPWTVGTSGKNPRTVRHPPKPPADF